MNFLFVFLFLILFLKIFDLRNDLNKLKKEVDSFHDKTIKSKINQPPVNITNTSHQPPLLKLTQLNNNLTPYIIPKKIDNNNLFSWIESLKDTVIKRWLQLVSVVSLGGALFYLCRWIALDFHFSNQHKMISLFITSVVLLLLPFIKKIQTNLYHENFKHIVRGLGFFGLFITTWYSFQLQIIGYNSFLTLFNLNCLFILAYAFIKPIKPISISQESLFLLPFIGIYLVVIDNMPLTITILSLCLLKEIIQSNQNYRMWLTGATTTNFLAVLLFIFPTLFKIQDFIPIQFIIMKLIIASLCLLALKNSSLYFISIGMTFGLLFGLPEQSSLNDFAIILSSFCFLVLLTSYYKKPKLNYSGVSFLFFLLLIYLLKPFDHDYFKFNADKYYTFESIVAVFWSGAYLFKKIISKPLFSFLIMSVLVIMGNHYLNLNLVIILPLVAYLLSKYKDEFPYIKQKRYFLFFIPWGIYLLDLLKNFLEHFSQIHTHSNSDYLLLPIFALESQHMLIKIFEVSLVIYLLIKQKILSKNLSILIINFSAWYIASTLLLLMGISDLYILIAQFYIIWAIKQFYDNGACHKMAGEGFTYPENLEIAQMGNFFMLVVFLAINIFLLNPLLTDSLYGIDLPLAKSLFNVSDYSLTLIYFFPLLFLKQANQDKTYQTNISIFINFVLGFYLVLIVRSFYHPHLGLEYGFKNMEMYIYSMLCISFSYYFIYQQRIKLGFAILGLTLIKIYLFDLAFLPNQYKFILLLILGLALSHLSFRNNKKETINLKKS